MGFYIYSNLTGNSDIFLDLSSHVTWSRNDGMSVLFNYITGSSL